MSAFDGQNDVSTTTTTTTTTQKLELPWNFSGCVIVYFSNEKKILKINEDIYNLCEENNRKRKIIFLSL